MGIGNLLKWQINSLNCDSFAKVFICGIKSHTGYFGSRRCIQEGDYVDNPIVFPELNATFRSDLSFRC